MTKPKKSHRSTQEIKALVTNANMDFDAITNAALNDYLPKIFSACPFADAFCIANSQCVSCQNAPKVIPQK